MARLGNGRANGAMGFGDPIELEYSDPWVDDKNVSMCQQCRDPFTAVNRKHHCRRCGAVVCQKCSPHKVDLVGFAEPERFCRPCYAETMRYRDFRRDHAHAMTTNLPFSRDYASFTLYLEMKEPFTTDLWLSDNLLLICYRDDRQTLQAKPTHLFKSIIEGCEGPEFRRRLKKTSCFCMEAEDEDLRKKESCLFTLEFNDGSSLPLSADTREIRNAWINRFRALNNVIPFARKYADRMGFDLRALIGAEEARIDNMDKNRRKLAVQDEARVASKQKRVSTTEQIRGKYQAAKRLSQT